MKKGFFDEFKEFALKGSLVELAVGLTVGIAFKDVANSLVQDVISPFIGLLVGKSDFSKMFYALDGAEYASLQAAIDAKAPIVTYGAFLNSVLEFAIIAVVIFLVIKQVNKLRRKKK